jgi:hypothetical protein
VLRSQRCCRRANVGVEHNWILVVDNQEPVDEGRSKQAGGSSSGEKWSWDTYRMQMDDEAEQEPEPESEGTLPRSGDEAEESEAHIRTYRCRASGRCRQTADGRLTTTFLASRRYLSLQQFERLGRTHTHTQLEALRRSDAFVSWCAQQGCSCIFAQQQDITALTVLPLSASQATRQVSACELGRRPTGRQLLSTRSFSGGRWRLHDVPARIVSERLHLF